MVDGPHNVRNCIEGVTALGRLRTADLVRAHGSCLRYASECYYVGHIPNVSKVTFGILNGPSCQEEQAV